MSQNFLSYAKPRFFISEKFIAEFQQKNSQKTDFDFEINRFKIRRVFLINKKNFRFHMNNFYQTWVSRYIFLCKMLWYWNPKIFIKNLMATLAIRVVKAVNKFYVSYLVNIYSRLRSIIGRRSDPTLRYQFIRAVKKFRLFLWETQIVEYNWWLIFLGSSWRHYFNIIPAFVRIKIVRNPLETIMGSFTWGCNMLFVTEKVKKYWKL